MILLSSFLAGNSFEGFVIDLMLQTFRNVKRACASGGDEFTLNCKSNGLDYNVSVGHVGSCTHYDLNLQNLQSYDLDF